MYFKCDECRTQFNSHEELMQNISHIGDLDVAGNSIINDLNDNPYTNDFQMDSLQVAVQDEKERYYIILE